MALIVIVFIINALIHCLGDYFLKRASINFSWRDIWLAIAAYVVTIPAWIWLLKLNKLAVMISVGAAANIIIMTLIGIFIFRENLTIREVVGVGFAIAAIAMFAK